MRNASLTAKCNSSMLAKMSKSIVSPCFFIIFCCSSMSAGMTRSLLAMASKPVHDDVMDDVC